MSSWKAKFWISVSSFKRWRGLWPPDPPICSSHWPLPFSDLSIFVVVNLRHLFFWTLLNYHHLTAFFNIFGLPTLLCVVSRILRHKCQSFCTLACFTPSKGAWSIRNKCFGIRSSSNFTKTPETGWNKEWKISLRVPPIPLSKESLCTKDNYNFFLHHFHEFVCNLPSFWTACFFFTSNIEQG